MAGRGALAERLPSKEGTPRLEAHSLIEAVRWVFVLVLTFSVPFVARQKEQNNDKPKLLIKIF